MFPSWSPLLGFILGAFIGSFLNMAIYRLPRGLSFVEPSRSFCPKCKHPLEGKDLIPLLSWLSTGGKCRYCRDKVASRYFWVEVLTGSLFAAIWWQYLVVSEEPLRAGFYALIAACLVAVIFIDWELYIIPDELNATILIFAVAYHGFNGSLDVALKGALLGWGLLFGIALLGRLAFGKDAMGDGDTKMMRGVGALLGPALLVANLGMAVILGIVGGVIGIVLAKKAAAPVAEQTEEDADDGWEPTPVKFVLLAGVWYLFCLDIVALFVPPLRRWIESKAPAEVIEEDDDWKPTATTIPFGPYLAAGALVCMIFATPIEKGLIQYFYGDQPVPEAMSSPLQSATTARLNPGPGGPRSS